MPTPIDGLDPVELTAFARLAQQDFDAQSQSLARFLPYRPVNDIRYTYTKGVDALVDEADVRAFDAESSIGRRPGTGRVSGELVAVSRKIPLSEYDQLRLRNAANDEIVDGVFADGARLGRGIAARYERFRGELLTTGDVAINENGVVSTYESGRDASLTVGAVDPLWSAHSTATPLLDVQGWNDLIEALTGVRGTRLLVGRSVMAHLGQVDEVRGAFAAPGNVPDRVLPDAVRETFLAFAEVTVEVYQPPAGMLNSPIAANMVVLLNDQAPLGATLYGTPLEALEPEYVGLAPQPGVVAGAWKEKDPLSVWTHAVAIGLPIMGAPDLTLSAQVLA